MLPGFRELYDEHFPFVWRSLRRLGLPEATVPDAVQEVFLVVYRRLPHFEERSRITTWLFRICMRKAKDYRRAAHVRRERLDASDEALHKASIDPAPSSLELAERQQDLALFDAALAYLEEEQRAVFILFELEDMTAEQIAEAVGIPLGTVYSRVRLARQAFRRAALRLAARAEAVYPPPRRAHGLP